MLQEKIVLAVFLVFSLTSFSQKDKMIGEYFLKLGGEKHLIEYRLNLKQDGTFTFHSYTNHKNGIAPIVEKFGKGNWLTEGKIISFETSKEKDLDDKHTLDFSNSKARFITKPLRDKTTRTIKTRLQFFESEIFWIERLEIHKL